MQQNPPNANQHRDKQEHVRRDALLRLLRSLFLENWGAKLLAIFIAVILWAGLISQDPSLTRDKQFTNVNVNVNGADTLKRNGFVVLDDVDALLDDVDVRVSVPQGQYANAAASNYSVRIDLSRIKAAGEQEVRILSTNTSTYGTVVEIVPPSITVQVDEYITRYRIPVSVVTEGEPPEGFHASDPSADPPIIAVSGPKSIVSRIVSAQVVANQATLPAKEGTVRRAMAFTLLDEDGQTIDSDLLQITSESVLIDAIVVEQTVYSQRVVYLSDLGLVTGEPADGYEIKGVYISPGIVTIAGRASIIQDINLLYADGTVSVNGLTQSINKSLRVRQPSTLKYVSTDTVTVAVEIGPITVSRTYEGRVTLQGLSAALRETGGARTATLHVTGAQPWLDGLSEEDITLLCDLSAITEPGTYTLPLSCAIRDDAGQSYTYEISPAEVVVTVTEN